MKATVYGIQLEGTAEEIHEYVKLANAPLVVKGKIDWSEANGWKVQDETSINLKFGSKEYSEFVKEIVKHEKLDESAGPEVGEDTGIRFDYGKLGNCQA